MKKDPRIFLEHILESIEKIEQFTKGISKEKFISNVQLQDAVIRRLEVIGEATKNLPVEFKNAKKSIPWNKISGMRDKLIHHYFGIDLDLTFRVIEKDLPNLKQKIKKLLEKKS